MRHRLAGRKLNRTSAHRTATLRNLAQSLIEHGQIRTTLVKAKELRPFVERLITLAKKARQDNLSARRRIIQILNDRAAIPAEQQEDYEEMSDARRDKVLRAKSGRRHRTGEARPGTPFTAESIVRKLIETVAASFEDRPGGYTRIIKLPDTRIGDGSPLAVIQFVGQEDSPGSITKPAKTARRRRAESRFRMVEKGSPRSLRAESAAEAETATDTPADATEAQADQVEDPEAHSDEADASQESDGADPAQPGQDGDEAETKPAE